MRAIRVHQPGPPEVLGVEELPDPRPGPGEVLVRIRAAGVNPVDTYLRAGLHGYTPQVPYTPGKDGAGVVEAVGSGVTRWAPGDRVYVAGSSTGTYAELALCQDSQAHPLAERLSFSQGAAVGVPYGAAYRALFQRARLQPAEVVLVHGASGGVGLAAVQLARAAGAVVVGSAGDTEGARLVAQAGAHHVLDHREPGHLEALGALSGGRGADVILEMLANVNLGRDLKALAVGGRVVVIGSRGPVEIDPRDAMQREASVLGMMLAAASPAEQAATHAALAAGFANGTLQPLVGREFPLEQAPEAHHLVVSWAGHGKIVLLP